MSIAKILVVDDEPGIRLFLSEILSRDGHQVTSAGSGPEALELIQRESFDLVLLDLKLPGMGGLEILAVLHQQRPDTVVIILTAHASLETAVAALRQGAQDYLFKPCKTVQLRESIRKGLLKRQRELQQRTLIQNLEYAFTSSLATIRATITERPGVGVAPPAEPPSSPQKVNEDEGRFLKHDPLLVDLSRHIILINGHLLELSPTEFDLLAFLISEAPKVISAQTLLREVQGYSSESWEASEIIRQHIHTLRRKIRAASGREDVIRTVRGKGYAVAE